MAFRSDSVATTMTHLSSKRLVIVSIVLVTIVNVYLIVDLIRKTSFAEETMSMLVHDEALSKYINERTLRKNSLYKALTEDIAPISANRIINADVLLTRALLQIEVLLALDTPFTAKEFFSEPITISDSLQNLLWIAQKELTASIYEYLQRDVEPVVSFYQNIYRDRIDALQKITDEMDRAANNTKKSFSYNVMLYDTTQPMEIVGTKHEDWISWNEYYTVVSKYLEKLVFFKTQPHAKEAQDRLYRIERMFPERGKINLYGKTYDLSHITRAELRSVYKYLQLAHIDMIMILDTKL